MKKFYIVILLAIIVLTFLQFNCNSPTAPNNNLTLSVADVSCTEAWLNLSAGSLSLPANILVNKNGNNFLSFTLTSRDTTLYDGTLSPNQTYTYQAVYGNNKSETVTAKTLDTTSNNFTFQTFLLGGAQSSVLNDVVIINDTVAYAVGAVYVNDSTGKPDPNAYNLAKWNGHSWKLLRVQFYTVRGNSHRTPYPASSVLAFSDSVIWISMDGDQVAKLKGSTQTESMFLPNSFSIKELWGENLNLIYAVGDNGIIDIFVNGIWQKLESGTDIKLLDVWGNEKDTWICGWEDFKPTVLLNYKNDVLTTVINNPNSSLFTYNPNAVSGAIESVWSNNTNNLFLLTWYGLYRVENDNFDKPKNLWSGDPNTWGLGKVRGNNVNDIVGAGVYGRIWHYNGVSWLFYNNLVNNSDNLNSVAIKGNLIIAVGYRYENGINNYALVQIGHR